MHEKSSKTQFQIMVNKQNRKTCTYKARRIIISQGLCIAKGYK